MTAVHPRRELTGIIGHTGVVCVDAGESFRSDRDGQTLVSPSGRALLAPVTLARSNRIMPSFAQRMATGCRSFCAGLSRMPSQFSTS